MCLDRRLALVFPIHDHTLIPCLHDGAAAHSHGHTWAIGRNISKALREYPPTFLVSGQEQQIFLPDLPTLGCSGAAGGSTIACGVDAFPPICAS